MTEDFLKTTFENAYAGVSPKELSPLVLAYIGDAVYEMLARTYVVSQGNAPVDKMNAKARRIVSASGQNEMYFKLKDCLTDEEEAVFRRGRNANSHTHSKNASVSEYRHATGLEALFGYLYLSGNNERIMELFGFLYQAEA